MLATRAIKSGNADGAVRGVLIVAIVFGHSRLLFENLPYYFPALYFWHVQGFFLLAFGRLHAMAEVNIPGRLARYLIPYIFVAGGVIGARFLIGPRDAEHAAAAVAALVIGSAPLLDIAAGLSLFWFLPALAGFTLVMILFARLLVRRPGAMPWMVVLAALAFVANVAAPPAVLQWLPLGVGLLGYLFGISILYAAAGPVIAGRFGPVPRIAGWIAIIGILAAEIWVIALGGSVNMSVFVFAKPPTIWLALLNGAATVAANLLTFQIARLFRNSAALQAVGARSMDIFLFHQFALFPLTSVIRHVWPKLPLALSLTGGVVAASAALLFGLAVSAILDRLPLVRSIVFPKDLGSFVDAVKGCSTRAPRPES